MEERKLICFDVDGTLTDIKSSWIAITEALGCSVNEVLSYYNDAMTGKISFSEGEKRVSDIFRKSGKAAKDFIENIFERESIKPEAIELIKYFHNRGYGVWLVSGSIDVHVKLVAKQVGADGFFAHSSLEFDRQGVLSKINYGGDQNPWKAIIVRKLAQDNKVLPSDIIFVGDDINDIDAFKLTGHGIAVYPYDEKLGQSAWKKVMSLSEIKDIIK